MSPCQQCPQRQRREDGFSLAETLVAIAIMSVLFAVIAGVVIQTSGTADKHARGVMTQADLLDTTSTLTRSLTLAERFLIAEDDVVQIESRENGVLTRTSYFVRDPADEVDERLSLDENLDLPDRRALISYREAVDEARGGDVLRVLVENYRSDAPLFSFYDAGNALMSSPVTGSGLGSIRRVALDVQADVEGRQNADGDLVPLRLETSVTPRLVRTAGSSVSDLVAPAYPVLRGILPPGLRTSTLAWSNVAGATSYALLRTTESTGETISYDLDAASFASSEPRYEDAGLAWGERYIYSIVAVGPGGLSDVSNEVALTVVPEQPAFLNVDPRNHAATATSARGLENRLVWTPRHGAEGYRVYRDGAFAWEGTSTAWTDGSRSYGGVHDYTVIAWNQGAYGSGGDSLMSPRVALISPPVAPDLTATARDGDRSLAWSASSNALKYSLERVSPAARTFADTTSRSYVDTQAVESPRFTYRVRAGNDAGWSPYSTSRAVDTRPEPPRLSSVREDEHNVLTWTQEVNATCYRLQRDGVDVYEGANRSYRDAVAWGSTSNYRVLACNKTGDSAWSNSQQVRQQPGPFNVNFDAWRSAQYGEERGAKITPRWTTSAAATEYTVYRTAARQYPYGGNWSWGYGAAHRNDVGQSSVVYPTGLYTYVVRATAANGESRDYRTTVQAPPELPREMVQETVYRTSGSGSMYGRFDISADPLDGSRDSTFVQNYGSDGYARWYGDARFTHQNATVNIQPGSLNAVLVQNYKANYSGAQVHFPTSQLQVFGVRQGQAGLDYMRARPRADYSVMDPEGAPSKGYYSPWGFTMSQWKVTGAFGQPEVWSG